MIPEIVGEVDWSGDPTASYYDTLINTTGVQSYWRMADAGATLTDAKALNNGTLEGSPSLVAGALPNDSNQALSFNGTSQDAFVPTSGSLETTGDFTLEGFVKFSSLPGAVKLIVGKQGSWSVSIDAANKLRFFMTNDNNAVLVVTGAGISANTWYHVAAIHDSVNDQVSLYLNGVLDQSSSYAFGPEVTGQPLRFAGFLATTGPTFQTFTTQVGSTTTATGTKPTGTASGDLLIAQLNAADAVTPTAVPAGWNLIGNASIGGAGANRERLYWKIAGGAEPASYSWTVDFGGSGARWVLAISRFSGVNTLWPFANALYGGGTASGTTHATGSHTPNQDNNMVVAFFSSAGAVTWTASPSSGAVTEQYDYNGGGTDAIAMYTQAQGTATALSVTGTSSGAATGTAHMLVLAGTGLGYTAVQLDEWTFRNEALSAAEVAADYQSRLSGIGSWVRLQDAQGVNDVRDLDIRYGRQYELNRIEGGEASTTLRNQHRRYDPTNTNSPYYPNVKPNRKIRFRALLNGVYYPLFQGFVDRWPPSWQLQNYDEVAVTISDGFKALNRAGVSGTIDAGLSGTQLSDLLNRALYPADARAIDAGLFVMAADTSTGTTEAKGLMQDIADSELGLFFFNHAAQVASGLTPATFHDRAHRWTNSRSITSQATFSDDGTFIAYKGLVPSDDDDNMVNEWNVATASGTVRTAVDTVSRSENYPVTQDRATRLDNNIDAQTQATALLQQTSKPNPRFDSLTVRLTTATQLAVWQKMLTLAISDRVTVIRTPVPAAGGSTVRKDCFIESITWAITPAVWDVSFQLSPVATSGYKDTVLLDGPVSYWRFDTTT